MCVDFIGLNAKTKPDVYPLPRIEDVLTGVKYSSKFDCYNGYYQFEVSENDREKTAVITQDGLFEYIRMPQGARNAPATFQRSMNIIMGGLKWQILLIFLDDILVFSEDFETHLLRLEEMFKRLLKYGLTVKPSKCVLAVESISFLGHVIDSEGIKMDPEKVVAIRNFPKPTKVLEVMSFVGLAGYYR